ncbi:MAG: hypothetical protein JXP34_15910 [Planctomycetes bacterium]|nr:hypothetical protein [Planctomycetota bacterium]
MSATVLAFLVVAGLSNDTLSVAVEEGDGRITVTDRRTGFEWRQVARPRGEVASFAADADSIRFSRRASGADPKVGVEIRLEKARPEIVVTLTGEGGMGGALAFPPPFATAPGMDLIIPMNEGIAYPVDDASIRETSLVAYGGHGICMAFWGVTDGRRGHMAILETADDAVIQIRRIDGNLTVAPRWQPQKGRFGYARRLRYVFFSDGGYVAMCKRYREHAASQGLLRTLEAKRKANPNVDLLVGAVNVWCWERDPLAIVRALREAGIDRILWSNRGSPRTIAEMNRIEGVLTSRYDIYQDLMDPKVVAEKLRGAHPDWTQEGWPDDLMRDAKGDWVKGWRVRGKDGVMYPCGVLCDRQALAHARDRIPAELKTHPYRCRFIDTTTASPWRECYDPDHPMTRSESKRWKMELLKCVCDEMDLVCGSETGHDAAVPYVHYFEGMLSLGPYRVPDAGRDMARIWDEVPENVAKFQLGHRYRLPLWELVFHDCVIAQWYWGDYNNKLPALWDKRDLFNVLYGTPPMFMFDRRLWERERDRFVRSYRTILPVARAAGYAEMTDHRYLAPDRSVQRTRFANGIAVTVNFGDAPHRLEGGEEIPAMGYVVSGLP